MDISNIDWKKLEDVTSLILLMKAKQIGFGTVFKVCRNFKELKYHHFYMVYMYNVFDKSFTVLQINYNFFRGPFLENREVSFKDGDNSLFDFSCGGVYFEESYIFKETSREAIRLRVKYFQSLCINYGFGPNRWNCESIINFIKYGKKRLSMRSEADNFSARYCITGPLFLWTVERLAVSKAKSRISRNHPRSYNCPISD